MAYKIADITEAIALNLGGGAQALETQRSHYERAIKAALRLLDRYRPMHGYVVLPVTYGGNKYKVVARNIIGVLDVTFFNSGGRLEFAPYYSRWVDRNIETGDRKDSQRAFDDKPEWHWMMEPDPVSGEDECWLYTTITQSSFVDTFARLPNTASVQFAWALDASDDPLVGVNRIPVDLRQWVEDYATARSRMILGDIRGKFGGIPGGADGSLLRNDGAAQVERAEQKCRELENDLSLRRRNSALILD